MQTTLAFRCNKIGREYIHFFHPERTADENALTFAALVPAELKIAFASLLALSELPTNISASHSRIGFPDAQDAHAQPPSQIIP
jgi:hypothetical protein